MRILVVKATEVETTGFNLSTHPFVDVLTTGVGKLNAYKAVRRALRQKAYSVVINIGTVGSKDFPIGTVLHPTELHQGDAFVDGDFQTETLYSGTLGSKVSLLTSDNFISSAQNEEGVYTLPDAVQGFDCYDMEGYAIASAADFMVDNVFFVKIVSDNLDGSVKDWEKSASCLSKDLVKSTESFIRRFIKDYEARRF